LLKKKAVRLVKTDSLLVLLGNATFGRFFPVRGARKTKKGQSDENIADEFSEGWGRHSSPFVVV